MKDKRIVERLFGRRRKGGWVLQRQQLLEALKKGEVFELDNVRVGANQLRRLIGLLPYDDCLIRANGRLEIETLQRVIRNNNGTRKTGFRKPKHYHQAISIVNGAWLRRNFTKILVLRPRKY